MRLKLKHITLSLSLLTLAVACKEEEAISINTPSEGKTPIEVTTACTKQLNENVITRAVVINGEGALRAFEKDTRLHLMMVSEYNNNKLYATATYKATGKSDPEINSKSSVTAVQQLYWDDAHGINSNIAVCGIAVPGVQRESYTFGTNTTTNRGTWNNTTITPTAKWTLTTAQTAETVTKGYDLCYTNNTIGTNTLKFNNDPNDATKYHHFDKGELIFQHALALFCIEVWCGEGFDSNSYDNFQFDKLSNGNPTNIAMNGFYGTGTLNFMEGTWSNQGVINFTSLDNAYYEFGGSGKTGNITSDNSEPYHVMLGLVVPGTDMKNTTVDNAFDFSIDGNNYKVTMKEIYDAIKAGTYKGTTISDWSKFFDKNKENTPDYSLVKQGVCYKIKLTVGKTKINNISAQIVDWEKVEANNLNPANDYINVAVKTNEGDKVTDATPNFTLYRAAGTDYSGVGTSEDYNKYEDYNWEKNYSAANSLEKNQVLSTDENIIYKTEWYWPNNNTFYHFRTLSPISQTLKDNENNTYVDLAGGTLVTVADAEPTAVDYLWGAPFKTSSPSPDNYSFTSGYCYNTTKKDGQLYKAIGSTSKNIVLIQHHMTSQIYVDLETTTGEDKVSLSNATVQLTNVATKGKLYLGDGKITNSDYSQIDMTYNHADAVTSGPEKDKHPEYDYLYSLVPQPLYNTNGNVGIIITTEDGNRYIINDLRTIKSGSNSIIEWIPGKKYYYKFTLKKTGIDHITATVVNWVNVEATNENITIQ